MLWRWLWRREPFAALPERLGFGAAPMAAERLWLHGASNGALTSARWVLEALLAARPGMAVLVTCNTGSARKMVRGWGLPGVTSAFAPLEAAGAVGRLLRRWRPMALITVEGELWSARIAAAAGAGVPVLWIGARLSERSARNWGHARRMIGALLGQLSYASAQDAGSAQRLASLGLPAGVRGPVQALKAQGHAAVGALPFAPTVERSRCLLAASTHDGEEGIVLDAFRAATGFDLLIVAPRHERRAGEVAGEVERRGLSLARRSRGEVPARGTAVYLADTMGEMDHWYRMAGVTVIGGTFGGKGGHTPWEPARYGSAILHGPSVANFAAPFAALDAAGGARAVAGAAELVAALHGMDAATQAAMARAATAVLATAVLASGTDGAGLIADILRICGPA